MNKEEFKEIFLTSLEIAAKNAEDSLKAKVPRNFEILLFGADRSGEKLSVEEAVSILYLGKELFYKIIDLSVVKISKNRTTVFTRVSSHQPTKFDLTWNEPKGFGPFKQLISDSIEFE